MSDQVGNPEDRFSQNEAHLKLMHSEGGCTESWVGALYTHFVGFVMWRRLNVLSLFGLPFLIKQQLTDLMLYIDDDFSLVYL